MTERYKKDGIISLVKVRNDHEVYIQIGMKCFSFISGQNFRYHGLKTGIHNYRHYG